jgi:sensor c-di-GMP phosphodiesterase-like protein
MTKKVATFLTLVIGLLAIAAPIFFTLQQARKQGLDAEAAHTLAYARDVVRRTDITSDQIVKGIERLVKSLPADPCSEASLAIMREVEMTSTYIQAMGYVSGDRLICSSYGKHKDGVSVGPVGLVLRNGATLRYDVKLPFAGQTPFLVIEQLGYAAVVHKELPIDAITAEEDVSLATFTTANQRFVASKGFVKPGWIDAARDRREASFIDGGYFVAVVRSERYNTGAIAALPVTYLDKRTHDLALWLVPTGLIAGIVLALAALYLARLQMGMPAVIRAALRRNEFFLVYQPVVELKTGKWIGAEALIRWRHPGGEVVRPDVFIQAAEDSGLIERITGRVTEIIARDAWDLFRQYPDFRIAINLSSADLKSQRTSELLRRLIREVKAGPHNFIVEATERGFMHADAARQVISQLRADGIQVAIDDFGTGCSSLSYLETFELDLLKIDNSFVEAVDTEAATSQVIPHIIEMAKTLKLQIIAEGVETEAQAQFLRERGVQYAQGWLFGKPVPLADLVKELWLQAGTKVVELRRSAA